MTAHGGAKQERGVAHEPVLLYDTTLRDGAQREGLTLSLQDKLRIARALDEFGMLAIEGGGLAQTRKTSNSSLRRRRFAGSVRDSPHSGARGTSPTSLVTTQI